MFDHSFFGPLEIGKVVKKSWGEERWLWNSEKYCAKILCIWKEHSGSYHYHNIKDELFYCLTGKIEILYGFTDNLKEANSFIMNPGDSFKVPATLRHKIIGIEHSELFEVSTFHSEEDVVRIL